MLARGPDTITPECHVAGQDVRVAETGVDPERGLELDLRRVEIALAEPRFIAFVPFIWSFDADADVPLFSSSDILAETTVAIAVGNAPLPRR